MSQSKSALKRMNLRERWTDVSGAMALSWTNSRGERNLWIALAVSLLLHGVLLSLHFKFPEASRAFQDKALDIILVNAKSARKPTDAQALAQANLDGGGNSEQNRRVRTPLPPSDRQQAGNDLDRAQKRQQALEAQQRKLLELAKSQKALPSANEQAPQPTPEPALSGRDLMSTAMQMARLQGEIARDTEEYNKRPRMKTVGLRAEEFSGAAYLDAWERKVEKIGTLNFPEQARGKMYGNVTVWVELRQDGTLHKHEIRRSAGLKVLDDAALRIVRMGSPYGEVPKAFIGAYDTIGFARTLRFVRSDQVEASN